MTRMEEMTLSGGDDMGEGYITGLETQHDVPRHHEEETHSLSSHYTGDKPYVSPSKTTIEIPQTSTHIPAPKATSSPPSPSVGEKVEYYSNEFKLRLAFNPWDLRSRGMSEPILTIPMRDVVNPRWRNEKDELGVTDESRVGELTLKAFDTNYFHPVSGRLSIVDRRNDIGSNMGEEVHPDRLGGDGIAKGADMRIQFTVTKDVRTSDSKVQLRPKQDDNPQSWLERNNVGHLSKADLWNYVEMAPGSKTYPAKKEYRITSIHTPLGAYMLEMLEEKKLTPVFQDKNNEVLLMKQEDAERSIDKLMLDRYKTLTVGELVDNGAFNICVTHADLEALADSKDEFASPWGDPGQDVLSIRDDELRKHETEAKLNRMYWIDMTLVADIQPTGF